MSDDKNKTSSSNIKLSMKDNLLFKKLIYAYLKKQNEFKNNEEFYEYIEEASLNAATLLYLNTEGKRNTINRNEYIHLLAYILPIKYLYKIDVNTKLKTDDKILFIKNFDSKHNEWVELKVERLIKIVNRVLNTNIISVNQSTAQLAVDTLDRLAHGNIGSELKLPEQHMLLFKNGLYNLKTKEFTTDQAKIDEYDYLHIVPYNYYQDKSKLDPIYLESVTRIFNDWAQHNPDNLTYIKQLCFAAMEGNGRNVYNIILGGGSNGKSTFIHILNNIAGKQYTASLNIQELADDNKFKYVNMNTKVVAGFDMATSAKISDLLMSRIKQFILGETFLINVKYQSDRDIVCNGLKIQATNTLPEIFENTYAVKRRFKIFQWTNEKFSKLENGLNLDKLVDGPASEQKSKFYEAIIYFVLHNMEYFESFINLESMDQLSDEVLTESDSIYMFLNDMQDKGVFDFQLIPINYLYKLYDNWIKTYNGGSKPLKINKFKAKLKTYADEFGIIIPDDDKRLKLSKKLNKFKFNHDLFIELFMKHTNFEKISSMFRYIETSTTITDDDIKRVKQELVDEPDYDSFSVKDKIIIEYLIQEQDEHAYLVKHNI